VTIRYRDRTLRRRPLFMVSSTLVQRGVSRGISWNTSCAPHGSHRSGATIRFKANDCVRDE
jgi:hypothetical protein